MTKKDAAPESAPPAESAVSILADIRAVLSTQKDVLEDILSLLTLAHDEIPSSFASAPSAPVAPDVVAAPSVHPVGQAIAAGVVECPVCQAVKGQPCFPKPHAERVATAPTEPPPPPSSPSASASP